jgi:hypothetical protein
MRKTAAVSIAALAISLMMMGAPASATHGGPHPTFKLQTDHFQCLADNRIQNFGRNSGQVPTWGPTAPTTALTAGGGCIQYENLLSNTGTYTSPWDLAFEGTFVGNLKTITFEIYLANLPQASVPELTANATLLVDGEPVHTATQTNFSPEAAGNIKKITFSYTRLDKRFATQDGDGDTERQIGFSFGSFNEQQILFAWGATDAPSKIVFNPETTAGQKFPI